MKRHFSTGLIFLLPFALTFFVVRYLFDTLTEPFADLIENRVLWGLKERSVFLLRHGGFVKFLSQLISLAFMFFLVALIGFLGRRFFFKIILKAVNVAIFRIPVIGRIYKLIKDVTKSFLSLEKKAFQETVLIPFPQANSYSLGFITGEAPLEVKKKVPDVDVIVFVPTAPHPIAGYVLFSSKSFVHSLDISTEEAFKFLVSCGSFPFSQKS
jgi:uncharacterized membrane protein